MAAEVKAVVESLGKDAWADLDELWVKLEPLVEEHCAELISMALKQAESACAEKEKAAKGPLAKLKYGAISEMLSMLGEALE